MNDIRLTEKKLFLPLDSRETLLPSSTQLVNRVLSVLAYDLVITKAVKIVFSYPIDPYVWLRSNFIAFKYKIQK